jgi:hypothetical protein
MHIIRALPTVAILYGVFCYTPKALGVIHLTDMMTTEEQKKTGVSNLTPGQKQELDAWLDQKFTVKTAAAKQPDIYLSENIRGGAQLRFSDGSTYEVSPQDRNRTEFWITPFLVKIEPSGDPNYPYKITNTLSGVSVSAKQVQVP